jgi:hypothetical protein
LEGVRKAISAERKAELKRRKKARNPEGKPAEKEK